MKTSRLFEADENLYNTILRKMAIMYIGIISAIFIIFANLHIKYDVPIIQYFLLLYAIQHIIWLVGFIFFKNIHLETFIIIYIIYIIIILFPVTCIYWNAGYPIAFFWYLLVLIGSMAFNPKYIIMWISFVVISAICIFLFSNMFPKMDFSAFIYKVHSLTIFTVIILSGFFAIVFVKMTKIKESIHKEILQTTAENSENLEKNNTLYNEIIEYLENQQPFKNPNFNAQILAKALKTNVNYVSKAISSAGDENFNMLINKFRIEYVKSLLNSDAMKKYTIDYIYKEAGYKYRSTFNTAFKNITGITPTDYMSQLDANKNINRN